MSSTLPPLLTLAVDASPKPTPEVQSVQVYTHNITRRPIAWDPARQRPTQELVHAIHSALHFALDPCVNHPTEEPSFCIVDAAPSSSGSTGNPAGGNVDKAYSSPPASGNLFTEDDALSNSASSTLARDLDSNGTRTSRTLIIPCVNDLARSVSKDPTRLLLGGNHSHSHSHSRPQTPQTTTQTSSQTHPHPQRPAELTVKLFAGFNNAPLTVSIVKEALDALRRSFPVTNGGSSAERGTVVDRFVVSLEGVKWSGKCPSGAEGEKKIEEKLDNRMGDWEAGMEHIDAMMDAWEVCCSCCPFAVITGGYLIGLYDGVFRYSTCLQNRISCNSALLTSPMRISPTSAASSTHGANPPLNLYHLHL